MWLVRGAARGVGRIGLARGLSTPVTRVTPAPSPAHLTLMQNMYEKAPINGLFNKHDLVYDEEGNTTLYFTPEDGHCHTMMSLHGAGYFKLLDDAAFFAAQARDQDHFIFTVSFNTYLVRPVLPGTPLRAKGKVVNSSKSLIIAEARLEEEATGKLVASASGTFQKSQHLLSKLK
jgi:uncharacterized protein (TIGR00369 family)